MSDSIETDQQSTTSNPHKYGTPEYYLHQEQTELERLLAGYRRRCIQQIRGAEIIKSIIPGLSLEDRKAVYSLVHKTPF